MEFLTFWKITPCSPVAGGAERKFSGETGPAGSRHLRSISRGSRGNLHSNENCRCADRSGSGHMKSLVYETSIPSVKDLIVRIPATDGRMHDMPGIFEYRDSGGPNDKAGYRSGTISSFQTSPSFVCSILTAIYASGSSEETSRHLVAFDIDIGALRPGVMVQVDSGYKSFTSLFGIDDHLNADWYIYDMLHPVAVPYLRGLPNTIFQQDNTRPHTLHKGLGPANIKAELDSNMGEAAPSFTTVKYWVAEFKRGCTSCPNEHHSNRPNEMMTPEMVKKIHKAVP
ncbi:mariner transposase [Trichonephila clavipes]|nr:mariner transposase [Trichonephila clavipes]